MRKPRPLCRSCGAQIVGGTRKKTCSESCRVAWLESRRRAESPVSECPICGNKDLLIHKTMGIRVCSIKCRTISQSRVYAKVKTRNPGEVRVFKPRKPLGVRRCFECGNEFEYKFYNAKYCPICRPVVRKRYLLGREAVKRRREKRTEKINEWPFCTICFTDREDIFTQSELGIERDGRKLINKYHLDHVQPKSKNGTDHPSNRRPACWFCNTARGNLGIEYDHAIAEAGKAFWLTVKEIRMALASSMPS